MQEFLICYSKMKGDMQESGIEKAKEKICISYLLKYSKCEIIMAIHWRKGRDSKVANKGILVNGDVFANLYSAVEYIQLKFKKNVQRYGMTFVSKLFLSIVS